MKAFSLLKIFLLLLISQKALAQREFNDLLETLNYMKMNDKCSLLYRSNPKAFKVDNLDIKKVIINESKNKEFFNYSTREKRNIHTREDGKTLTALFTPSFIKALQSGESYPGGVYYFANEPYSSISYGQNLTRLKLTENVNILDISTGGKLQELRTIRLKLSEKFPAIKYCSENYFNFLFSWQNNLKVIKYSHQWYFSTDPLTIQKNLRYTKLKSPNTDYKKREITEMIIKDGSYKDFLPGSSIEMCNKLYYIDLEDNVRARIKKELKCDNY